MWFGPRDQILGPSSNICNFLTKPHNMGVYGITCTPATIFKVIWSLGPNFCSKGPLAPNSKNCNFLIKPHNTGVYGLAWTPALIFEVIFDYGTKFLNQGPFGPNLKKCNFLTRSHKMGVYGITWTPEIIVRWFGPWGQIFAPRAFGPKFKKLQFSHKTQQDGCLWTHLDPSNHVWGNLDPVAKF